MDVIAYMLYFESFCLQIPEKAESLEDDKWEGNIDQCFVCKGEFSTSFTYFESGFNFYTGEWEWSIVCLSCYAGIQHNMPRWLFV